MSKKDNKTAKPIDKSDVKTGNGLGNIIKSKWLSKSPVLLFTAGFALFMVAYYLISFTQFYENYIFQPLVNSNAWITSKLVGLFGIKSEAIGNTVKGEAFSVDIKQGCDALEATALFWAATTAFPFSWKSKLPAYVYGTLFLLGMNLLRVISLFLTGIYFPAAFDVMHLDVWQAIFIILAIVTWAVWINWAKKHQ